MAVKFTEKQWERMVTALEKKFSNLGEDLTEVTNFISTYKAPRASRAQNPEGKKKRVPNAYILWTKENREKIVEEHFEGVSPKASEVTKKASELWKSLTAEEKKPWEDKSSELKAEAGETSRTTLSWNFEKKTDVEVPEGWSGPHMGKYLAKSAAKGRGVGRFATFEEAVEAANALGNKCGGITLEQKAYTLRVGNDPIKHPNPAQSTYSEASWTKNDFEAEVEEKTPKKKKTKKEAEPEPESEENEENEVYNAETEDEDDDETEVERWNFKGEIYLLDPKTGEVYDSESCELIGKKGEGQFAEESSSKKKVMKKKTGGN